MLPVTRKHAMPKHMFAADYFHGDEKQLQKSLDVDRGTLGKIRGITTTP